MKVYLATSGEYSDYGVRHVFKNKEDADAYAGADATEEFELREGPVEMRTWHFLYWKPGQPDRDRNGADAGNPWMSSESRDFDGDPRHAGHQWSDDRLAVKTLMIQGWDRDRVLKVYSEQRAQYLAAQQGVSG